MNKPYGKELILDVHNCDAEFTREHIEKYFEDLCILIDMKRCGLHFWDDLDTPEPEKQTEDHTEGTSAIQFILTSNITIHTLDRLRKVFVNIFSCKEFDSNVAVEFTKGWFEGELVNRVEVTRI